MLSKLKWIYTWWYKRQAMKRKAILNRPDRNPLERCSDLLEYLGMVEFTMSRQALGFYRTRLMAIDQTEFRYIVGQINQRLRQNGGLVRDDVSALERLYGNEASSMASFFGYDNLPNTFKAFHLIVSDFISALLAIQGSEDIKAIHTLRIIAPFVMVLKETLETLASTT